MAAKLLTGIVKRHPDGFGFMIPDDHDHPDVYIPKQSMLGVMSQDTIEIEVFRSELRKLHVQPLQRHQIHPGRDAPRQWRRW